MDLLAEAKIKELLEDKGIKAQKEQGQNFLTSEPVLNNIIEAAELSKKDQVLEIGAGLGAITKALAQRANQVIAVEKDSRLVEVLKETCDLENVRIINKDFLKMDLQQPMSENFKVVSSLPFSAATPIIEKLLKQSSPQLMAVTVQKEVAEKITAAPPNMNRLAIIVQLYGKPEIETVISKQEFWPQPKVNSALLKINNILPLDYQLRRSDQKILKAVKAGFAHSRKQLVNTLKLELDFNKEQLEQVLKQADINPDRRAETLKVEEWIKLSKLITSSTQYF